MLDWIPSATHVLLVPISPPAGRLLVRNTPDRWRWPSGIPMDCCGFEGLRFDPSNSCSVLHCFIFPSWKRSFLIRGVVELVRRLALVLWATGRYWWEVGYSSWSLSVQGRAFGWVGFFYRIRRDFSASHTGIYWWRVRIFPTGVNSFHFGCDGGNFRVIRDSSWYVGSYFYYRLPGWTVWRLIIQLFHQILARSRRKLCPECQ